MAAPTDSITFDSFFTSTIKKYEKQLQKNFIEYRPSVNVLMDDYGHKDSGGYAVQIPVEYGNVNSNTTFFTGAQRIGTDPVQFAFPAIYQWRHLASSATITDTDKVANTGKEKLFDLMEGRINNALRSIATVLGSENYSDGSNYGGNTIVGLAAGVSTTPSTNPSSGNVGGIDASPTGYIWWRNFAATSCGSFAANGVKGTSQDLVFNAFNSITDGASQKPKSLLSDQNTFQYYNQTLLGTTRYLDPLRSKNGDLSFGGLDYQGITWMWDRQCPSGRIYMLNPSFAHYYVDPQMMFTWTAPRMWPDQLTETRLVSLRVALVYKARMWHAVLDGWTA